MEESILDSRIEDIHEMVGEILKKVDSLSGDEMCRKVIECYEALISREIKLEKKLQKYYEDVEDNKKRFNSMINELKGVVSMCRGTLSEGKKFSAIVDMLMKLKIEGESS